MTQDHILRYVRITNSGKLSDRYVTTQIKEASDPDSRVYGRLFAIVEIESPWFPNSQIGQTIINTVAREYYKGTDDDSLERFEAALKKANETLGHLAQTGERDWVDRLHAALILVRGDAIHLATTGEAHGWLLRGGKPSPVIEPSDGTVAPTKTFGSVLSGTLEPGDRLIFTSSGILSLATLTELKTNVFNVEDMATAAIRLTNLLKAKRGQWVNALILDYQETQTLANRSVIPLPETLYLDTAQVGDWRITMGQVVQRSREGLLQLGIRFKRLNAAIDRFVRTTLVPKSKAAFDRTSAWSRKAVTEFQTKTLPAVHASLRERATTKLRELKPPAPSVHETVPSPGENLIGKSVYAINDYSATDTAPADFAEPHVDEALASNITDPANAELAEPMPIHHYTEAPRMALTRPSFTQRLLRFSSLKLPRSFAVLTQRRSYGFLVVAGILLLLVIVNVRSLSARHANTLSRTQAAAKLTDLQDKLEEAKLAKVFNQNDKAIATLQNVLAGTASLASSPLANEAHELDNNAQALLDQLMAMTRLKPEVIATLNGAQLSIWGDHLTVVTAYGLQTVGTSGGTPTALALPNGEALGALTNFDQKDGFAVLTSKPAVYQTTQPGGPLEPITPKSGSWNAGVALAPYFNSLYVLAPSTKQIWKYALTNGEYGTGEPYIQDGTGIEDATDLAIDGNIYVLKASGDIVKFTRGKHADFTISNLPKPTDKLTKPSQVEVGKDAVYVLDRMRIVKLATDGKFIAQYGLPDNASIRSFALKDSTIYLLTDTQIVKAGL